MAKPFSAFILVKKAGGSRAAPLPPSADGGIPDASRARQGVNFNQSCGLFERGDALQERACPYGEYTHFFSAIRLQKGGLNGSCLGGFPQICARPKTPSGTLSDIVLYWIFVFILSHKVHKVKKKDTPKGECPLRFINSGCRRRCGCRRLRRCRPSPS